MCPIQSSSKSCWFGVDEINLYLLPVQGEGGGGEGGGGERGVEHFVYISSVRNSPFSTSLAFITTHFYFSPYF